MPQELKSALLLKLLTGGEIQDALVFTRTKHRANRLADYLVRNRIQAERIHGNRSQTQRTAALAGFKAGKYQVLVATDIAARGIDVEALGHVVNFDVPLVPEDYIHRVGRTARAEATGDAFTFVAPDEEGDLRAIERAIGKRLPRVEVPDFDYKARPEARLEIPLAERIKEIRARKSQERARADANRQRRGGAPGQHGQGSGATGQGGQGQRSGQGQGQGHGPRPPRPGGFRSGGPGGNRPPHPGEASGQGEDDSERGRSCRPPTSELSLRAGPHARARRASARGLARPGGRGRCSSSPAIAVVPRYIISP